MQSIRASKLAFAHGDRVALFEGVSFHLSPGFYGVVGPNGAGKTTLGRLIARELQPSAGSLTLSPEDSRVVFCEQRVDRLAAEVVEFAADESGAARKLRDRLRLIPEDLERYPTLSPGERKRWQVGAALFSEPDVLILDEPTNHLDRTVRALILAALERFSGIGLVVSHDRELLERLTAHTLRVHGGTIELFPGSYGTARALWEARGKRELEVREQRVEARDALENRLDRARREQAKAQRELSTNVKQRNKNDSDARGIGAKNLVSWAVGRLGKDARHLRHELERSSAEIPAFVVDKSIGRSVFAGYERAQKPVLTELAAGVVEVAGSPLLEHRYLALARDARVELRGENGAGKSTLLAALFSRNLVGAGLVHVPQEISEHEAKLLLDWLRGLARDERGHVLSVVAALGLDPDRLLATSAPSPGEARKLAIARALARKAFGLLLDEPTNHLDLPSVERLQAALSAYPGALLLVSHDEAFASALTDTVWEIRQRELHSFTRER
jgi:ATPase subunit of ABC transporter with duplicated ATPase domains